MNADPRTTPPHRAPVTDLEAWRARRQAEQEDKMIDVETWMGAAIVVLIVGIVLFAAWAAGVGW